MLSGYAGQILRVNLTKLTCTTEPLDPQVAHDWVGGVGLGARCLVREVSPEVSWDSPDNKIFIFTGPFAGTRVSGSGTIGVVTKGCLTDGSASSQANGFMGAYLKFCGYDGIILEGQAPDWTWLWIDEQGTPALLDARDLLGVDQWDLRDVVAEKMGRKMPLTSVFGIGQAGEHLVRFATIGGDHGHVAAHNGVGAVMGAKRLKAIGVARGKKAIPIVNSDLYNSAARTLKEENNATPVAQGIGEWGTAGGIAGLHKVGILPVRNYTTCIFPEHEVLTGQHLRTRFKVKAHPCWACGLRDHCELMEVTEGPYTGFKGEEPEYEGMASMGSQIGVTDPGAAVMLANMCDRWGIDVNEAGWVLGWVIECYEAGIFTREQLGGHDMRWGNAEAARVLLEDICHRRGPAGQWLAEGVKRAAEASPPAARSRAVYTKKGNTPRTHDHRAAWWELLDTVVSSTGTIESSGRKAQPEQHGIEPMRDPFSWEQIANQQGRLNGRRLFEDTLGVCQFTAYHVDWMVETLKGITGWDDFTVDTAMTVGRRAVNALRLFNFQCGITAEHEYPSERYGSTPADGPAKGASVMANWHAMRSMYYELNGWHRENGKPLPETLERLGLGEFVSVLWEDGAGDD